MRRVPLFLILSIASVAHADSLEVQGVLLSSGPQVDGTIVPAEWERAAQFKGLLDEQTGEPSAEGGEFWLAYDAQFVYFAARLSDRKPQLIQREEYRTNVSLSGNDTITLRLDPFGELTDFSSFSMNPRGATAVEISGGRAPKREWLGAFLAQGRVTETGWEVEARIPWNMMRLPAAGARDLRFNVIRRFQRLQRNFVLGYTSGGKVENTPTWRQVELPPADPPRWRMLGYTYVGAQDGRGPLVNGGLDLRRPITDQADFVASISPDFRNVENQVLSLDFSYFERLAGESRPFFLEGANFFATSRDVPLFASQRIPRFDLGAKAFGKLDDHTNIGILSTLDFGDRSDIAFKVRRQLAERENLDFAYVRSDRPDLQNAGWFANYGHGIGPWFAFASLTRVEDSLAGNGHRINVGGSLQEGLITANAEYIEISDAFNPRLGFVQDRGFRGGFASLRYRRPTDWRGLAEYGYDVSLSQYEKFASKGLHRRTARLSTSTTWTDGTDFDVDLSADRFRGYDDQVARFSLERPRDNPYRRWSLDYAVGTRAGQRYERAGVGASYRPLTTLQFSGSVAAATLLGEKQSQVIAGATWDLGGDQSVSARYVRANRDQNVYFAFRRSGNTGAEYYVIVGDPNALTFQRSLIVKAVLPFSL